jgi:hypothetical protein
MVSDEDIKKLAFSIWEQEGHPQGKDVEHYLRAKQILEQREINRVPELPPYSPASELTPSLRPEELPEPPTKRRSRIRNTKT